MKFSKFFISMLGVILIGISFGYVLGYYFHRIDGQGFGLYLSVILMGLGTFLSIYGSMFHKNK